MYLGAKIFDDLPIEVRKHCKENNFNSILKNHFKFILILLKVLYVLLSILVYLSTYPTQCLQSLTFIGCGIPGASCPRNVLLILPCYWSTSSNSECEFWSCIFDFYRNHKKSIKNNKK